MQTENNQERNILLWAMFLSSLTGLSIWYIRRLTAAPFAEWGSESIVTFSYFTNLTNALVIIMTASLLFGRGRVRDWFAKPPVQAAVSLYIAFVGLAFWFLLGGPGDDLSAVLWLAELTAHTLSPILGFVLWLRAIPRGQLTWRHPLLWLIYPVIYLVYWLFRGPLVGYYPYFFVDVNALGYGGVARWTVILITAFLVLGGSMLLVDRRRAAVS